VNGTQLRVEGGRTGENDLDELLLRGFEICEQAKIEQDALVEEVGVVEEHDRARTFDVDVDQTAAEPREQITRAFLAPTPAPRSMQIRRTRSAKLRKLPPSTTT
jgi:hypothetical protein